MADLRQLYLTPHIESHLIGRLGVDNHYNQKQRRRLSREFKISPRPRQRGRRMRGLSGKSHPGRHHGTRRRSEATAPPVPSRGHIVSGDKPEAGASEPPALRCDRCQGALAFVMTVFQTRVFECTQCKKGLLIPGPQRDEWPAVRRAIDLTE
jgi:hypothetical protein